MQSTTVRTDRTSVNPYKVGAVLTQVASYLATYAFFAAVLTDMPRLAVAGIALVAEFMLTLCKNALLNGRSGDDIIGWVGMGLDTLLNAGGTWPYMRNLAMTPPAIMLAEALGIQRQISTGAALAIAVILGYILAVLPWRLWRHGSR